MWLYKKEKWLFECWGLKKSEDIRARELGVSNDKFLAFGMLKTKNQTTSHVVICQIILTHACYSTLLLV